MHPPHINALFEVAFYISHLKWIKENVCFFVWFWLNHQFRFHTCVYCHWVRANNWDKLMEKKIYQLSFRTLLDDFKNVEFERGSKFTLIFFFYIYVYCTTNSNKSFACISSVKMLAHWDWHQNHYCYIVLFHHDRTNWSLWRTCVL